MQQQSDEHAHPGSQGPPAPRRGPRAAGVDLRERILEAAAETFGESGYQASTIRRIGAAAGVDAKLVHYYFGTKEDLFTSAIVEAFRARGLPGLLSDRLSRSDGTPGVQYVRAVLSALEDPGLGPAFIGLVRGLGSHEESRRIFLRFVGQELVGRLAPQLSGEHAEARVTLAGTQMLGLVMARYVLKVPHLADLDIEQVAGAVGPAIDRYILGDVTWEAAAPGA